MISENREKSGDTRRYWLDDPKNVRKIVLTLFVVCGLLFIADAFYEKHSHFAAEDIFGFYAIYGFVMCVALVLAAKVMRVFLMRDEDYYDRDQ